MLKLSKLPFLPIKNTEIRTVGQNNEKNGTTFARVVGFCLAL
jgi:hypothetical protein